MNDIIKSIFEFIESIMPILRIIWIASIFFGTCLIAGGYLLFKKDSSKKVRYIACLVIGIIMVISSSTQLVFSIF